MRVCVLGAILGIGLLNSCVLPVQKEPIIGMQRQAFTNIDGESISDFIIQKINSNYPSQNNVKKDSTQQAWYQWGRSGQNSPDLQLNDVLLKSSQSSLLTNQGTLAVRPDYSGVQIPLILKGSFRKSKKAALESSDFAFQYEQPLLHQTFLTPRPEARILLDQSILLEVISVSEDEIACVLHTQAIPDLYLKGSHRLSIEYGDQVSEQWINIGEPEETRESLSPRIESVRVLNNDEQKPALLLLKGQHFMLYPKYAYAMIDEHFVFGYQTEIFRDGTAQSLLHLPENFDVSTSHTLMYATPFGTQFFRFGGNP